MDGQTNKSDGRTDQRTDGPREQDVKLHNKRLKSNLHIAVSYFLYYKQINQTFLKISFVYFFLYFSF